MKFIHELKTQNGSKEFQKKAKVMNKSEIDSVIDRI